VPTTVEEITRVFDADNHYWETSDAFTRHRDPRFNDRGLQVKQVDGVLRYVIDGQVFQGLPGPADVHPRPSPGSLLGLFPGRLKGKDFTDAFEVAPAEHPEWYDRDTRLRVMDEQGLEAAWVFPSQGVVLEAPMQTDIEAAVEVMRAFNRWLEEEWGFAYKDRIFAVPYMNLSDADGAVQDLRWCIEHGARVVTLRHGPAVTRDGMRSPADPMFDRFWGLAQEADVVVAPHAGADLSYADFSTLLSRVWGQDDSSTTSTRSVATMLDTASPFAALMRSRLIHDFAFVLVAHRLFERFPRLRVAYIENGGAWVPPLLHTLEYLGHRGDYRADPKDQFIEHCWVAPFVEEDVDDLARYLPVERILFGSDWPHGEGYPEPRDFFENVANFSLADQRRIMYDNARELTFG
jgi:predicted TIM-barrel fold metal-dependent hydrolase